MPVLLSDYRLANGSSYYTWPAINQASWRGYPVCQQDMVIERDQLSGERMLVQVWIVG